MKKEHDIVHWDGMTLGCLNVICIILGLNILGAVLGFLIPILWAVFIEVFFGVLGLGGALLALCATYRLYHVAKRGDTKQFVWSLGCVDIGILFAGAGIEHFFGKTGWHTVAKVFMWGSGVPLAIVCLILLLALLYQGLQFVLKKVRDFLKMLRD